MIAQAVQILLLADAAISAIVGTRVHLAERPQKFPLPSIVVQVGSAAEQHHLRGRTGTVRGFVRATVLAGTYLAAQDLATAVRAALAGYSGTVIVQDAQGIAQDLHIDSLLHDDQTDIPTDHRDGAGQAMTHGVQIDFRYCNQKPTTHQED